MMAEPPREAMHEVGLDDPEVVVIRLERTARSRRGRRSLAMLAVTLFGVSAWLLHKDLPYAFAPRQPVELGSIPDLYLQLARKHPAQPPSLGVEPNRLVHAKNLPTTQRAESDTRHFFYSPLFDIVVRTTRPLPRVERIAVEVDQRWVPLIEKRLVFPEDLAGAFEARGRLIHLADAPFWERAVLHYFAPRLRVPPEKAWLLLDGDEPSDYVWIPVVLAVEGLGALAAVWWWLQAVRREAVLREALLRAEGA